VKVIQEDRLLEVIAQVLELEIENLDLDASIIDDLGADSLDIVDISFSLEKKLEIQLPTKTLLALADEVLQGSDLLQTKGKLTDLGALFLQQGPNQYSADVAKPGADVNQIMADTTSRNWFNLCEFVAKHPGRDRDAAFIQYIKDFTAQHEVGC